MAWGKKRGNLEALFDAAISLRRLDQREEAVKQLREVLRLDAGDHQFARYWLAASLLDLQQHDDLMQLLERCEEPTALWRYAQTLLAYRRGGDTEDSRRLLKEASQLDADFLDYLLGESMVHADRPVRFDRDRQETTHSLAALFLPAWRDTPGAASWVRRVLRVPLGAPPAESPFPRRELRGLPRRNVRWQIGLRLLDQEEPTSHENRAWILGVVNLDDQKMLYMTVLEEEPTAEAVWQEVIAAFLQPMEGKPHRPARLEVPRAEFCRAWEPRLGEISVKCVFQRDPQPITEMLGGMANLLREQRLPPLPKNLDPREFPQTDAVWQADLFHMPTMISNEEVGVEQPWAAIVVDKQSHFVLSNEMSLGEPTLEFLWEHILRTMTHPGLLDPMRPSKIELSDSDGYDFMKPKLRELGVACVLLDELPELQNFCLALVSSYGRYEKCALADGADVTRDQMESFYYAAARYFEQAPWKHVLGEFPIEIRCRGLSTGTLYAIVLGRTGVTLGLALYRDWDDVLATLRGLGDPDEMSGFAVIFDEIAIMSPADLYLVERNGWPIRTPEAYPVIMRREPGQQPQSPSSEDLDYLESCLGIVPDFVTCGLEAKTYEVVTNGKQLKMRLSWKSLTR